MSNYRVPIFIAKVFVSFIGFVGVIIALRMGNFMRPEVALLMLVALIGLYVGVGVLAGVYKMIAKLDGESHQLESRHKPSDAE